MSSKVPNGFHQAIVSATVFLAGITLGFLKFFVVDGSSGEWPLFAAFSVFGVVAAIVMQMLPSTERSGSKTAILATSQQRPICSCAAYAS